MLAFALFVGPFFPLIARAEGNVSVAVINSFSISPVSVVQGQDMVWTGSATRGTNPIARYRAYIIGSSVQAWTIATNPDFVSFADYSVPTLTNPRNFWKGAGNYTARFEVQDSIGLSVLSDITTTVMAPPALATSSSPGTVGGGGSGGGSQSISSTTPGTTPSATGGSPVGGGNGSMSSAGSAATVIAVGAPTTTSSSGGGGSSRRRCTGFGCPTASVYSGIVSADTIIIMDDVLSANVVSGPEKVCAADNFVNTFLRAGIDNNPDEVRKLQYFLNTYENAGLVVNGQFDSVTTEAVKALQLKHADRILAPWGVNEPTGIVYLTTTRYINTVYCGDNPGFKDNSSIKDIPVNPADIEGMIGQATSGLSGNIAGIAGSLSDRFRQTLKDIHLYGVMIILVLLAGTGFVLYGVVKKDIISEKRDMSLMRGLAVLCIGSVLNVLNTLSFMLDPGWFAKKINLTLPWLLGLDMANLVLVIVISLSVLITLYGRISKMVK